MQVPSGSGLADYFARRVAAECGCEFPVAGYGYDVAKFFHKAEFRDVLDAITILPQVLARTARGDTSRGEIARDWIAFCARAMREEGMAYAVAANGDVRYLVDTAFQETATSVIEALNAPRFSGAKSCVQSAVDAITQVRPDGKVAIRAMFEGMETIFKIVTDDNKSLDATNAERLLQPTVSHAHANSDAIARGAADQFLQSFRDWVNACHKYRHGHREQRPGRAAARTCNCPRQRRPIVRTLDFRILGRLKPWASASSAALSCSRACASTSRSQASRLRSAGAARWRHTESCT